MTLPTAPPRIMLKLKANSFCPGCERSSQTMNSEAATASATKNQRCQPPAPARNENAAPVLWARTMLKKLVT